MSNGLLLINKEKDYTSRDVVNKLVHIFHDKKFGHSGTLDPFATGLLLIANGRALRLLPYLEDLTKTYVAKLKLGEQTDTGDLTGTLIKKEEVRIYTEKEIIEVLNSFLGKSFQIPPMYSAIKKDGVALYKLARQGIEVKRKPREINIDSIKLLSYKDSIIEFEVSVSKGTYIRVLGEDIAKRLNTVGHLLDLKRTRIGNYYLKDAKMISEVTLDDFIDMDKIKISINKLVIFDKKLLHDVQNGQKIKLDIKDDIILLSDDTCYLAIYERIDNSNTFRCKRGLL